jgi:hypothetical protein
MLELTPYVLVKSPSFALVYLKKYTCRRKKGQKRKRNREEDEGKGGKGIEGTKKEAYLREGIHCYSQQRLRESNLLLFALNYLTPKKVLFSQ